MQHFRRRSVRIPALRPSAAFVATAALIAVGAAGCSSGDAPLQSETYSFSAPSSATEETEQTAAAAQGLNERMQTEVIEVVQETTGAASGNGPDGTDRSHMVVEVYADRADVADADVAHMEERVTALAVEAGLTVSFLYGGEVTGS